MTDVANHAAAHPIRLLVTIGAVVVTSWVAAGWAVVVAFDASRDADVTTCRQVNELRREIYVAAADLGVPQPVRERFLPTRDCDAIP